MFRRRAEFRERTGATKRWAPTLLVVAMRKHKGAERALRRGRHATRIVADGDLPLERSPQALSDLVQSEVARWTPILKAAGAVGTQ